MVNELRICPNPASDVLYVSGFSAISKGDEATISLQGLTVGVYTLKINTKHSL